MQKEPVGVNISGAKGVKEKVPERSEGQACKDQGQ